MKSFKLSAIAMLAFMASIFSTQVLAQPVISEYVEGSSDNKCIEIWNPTGSSINLSDYGYRAYQNGSASPTIDFVLPSATLAAGDVYVICHPDAAVECTGNADATDTDIDFNGDDAIALYEVSSGNNVDEFGTIGEDPGSFWTGTCGHRTQGYTLRRLISASSGVTGASTGFPTLCSNWQMYSLDDCSDLGLAPSEEVLDCFPIISEYVEGTFSCKFIEVYNPCCDAINLSAFEVRIHFNACSSTLSIPLAGILAGNSLAPGATVVLYNPLETCSSFYVSGIYPSNFKGSGSLNHNGNDAVTLVYTADGSYKDIVGNICENTTWNGLCGNSTENQTLTRNGDICVGVTTDPASGFPTLCSDWTRSSVNTVTGLGSHTSDCLEGCEAGKKASTAAEAAGTDIIAYPNPFNSSAKVRFQVGESAFTQVEVYTMTGAKVATLFQGTAEAGQVYEVTFDGEDLPAGIYHYRLLTASHQQVGQMILAR